MKRSHLSLKGSDPSTRKKPKIQPSLGGNMGGPFDEFWLFRKEVSYKDAYKCACKRWRGRPYISHDALISIPDDAMDDIQKALKTVPFFFPNLSADGQEGSSAKSGRSKHASHRAMDGIARYAMSILTKDGAEAAAKAFRGLIVSHADGPEKVLTTYYYEGEHSSKIVEVRWASRDTYIAALEGLAHFADCVAADTHYLYHFGV